LVSRCRGISARAGMSALFRHSLLQVALLLAVLFVLTALGFALLRRLRRWYGGSAGDRLSASELLTKFRDLHSQGGLSDGEYRTIKTKLATQLGSELSDDDKTS